MYRKRLCEVDKLFRWWWIRFSRTVEDAPVLLLGFHRHRAERTKLRAIPRPRACVVCLRWKQGRAGRDRWMGGTGGRNGLGNILSFFTDGKRLFVPTVSFAMKLLKLFDCRRFLFSLFAYYRARARALRLIVHPEATGRPAGFCLTTTGNVRTPGTSPPVCRQHSFKRLGCEGGRWIYGWQGFWDGEEERAGWGEIWCVASVARGARHGRVGSIAAYHGVDAVLVSWCLTFCLEICEAQVNCSHLSTGRQLSITYNRCLSNNLSLLVLLRSSVWAKETYALPVFLGFTCIVRFDGQVGLALDDV